MNKGELLDAVAEQSALSKADVSRAMDAAIDVIAKALKQNDKVSVVGFGGFQVRERPERMGRNPKTGEPMPIAASRSPTFKAGKAFKDAIN